MSIVLAGIIGLCWIGAVDTCTPCDLNNPPVLVKGEKTETVIDKTEDLCVYSVKVTTIIITDQVPGICRPLEVKAYVYNGGVQRTVVCKSDLFVVCKAESKKYDIDWGFGDVNERGSHGASQCTTLMLDFDTETTVPFGHCECRD